MESVMVELPNWRASLQARFAQQRGSQREFARKIGCSESHLSLVLKDGRSVSYRLAKRISEEIGVTVDQVMSPPTQPEAAE